MANQPNLTPEQQAEREKVRMLDEQALGIKNLLKLQYKRLDAAKQLSTYEKLSKSLTADQLFNANMLRDATDEVRKLEQEIKKEKEKGLGADRQLLRDKSRQLAHTVDLQKELLKTEGGQLEAQRRGFEDSKKALDAERGLIKDINKQRTIGAWIMNQFRTKEERQRRLDMQRVRVGGGAQTGKAGGKGGGDEEIASAAASGGPYAALAAKIKQMANSIKQSFQQVAGVIKSAMLAPMQQVAALAGGGIGGGYGIGGGGISGGGATSILDGVQKIAEAIPFIGKFLGPVVGLFKVLADTVLGIDQGLTNYARNLGISKEAAKAQKEEFREIARASNNVVINETRLMESQVELSKELGVRSRLSNQILETNIELKEQIGLELETRKQIAQLSVLQEKDSKALTQSILAQTKAFEFETGIAFDFRQTLSESVKLSGYLGLSFAKADKNVVKTLMTTKALGFELKQLDSMASSFLDFESSISKEMEAQVLTGKEMNLTAAREAALNNDHVTLAREITRQVGDSTKFLGLNRIAQEAVAESVGMTRDSLADVLKQQEMYSKLGATNIKQAQEELALLRKQGLTEQQITDKIGKQAYDYVSQISAAEKLNEAMNKIKNGFIEFLEKSKVLDFITNPEKVQGFIKKVLDFVAGTFVKLGELVAMIMSGFGSVVSFFDKSTGASMKAMAYSIKEQSSAFGGQIRKITTDMVNQGESTQPATSRKAGETEGGSVSQTKVEATKKAAERQAPTAQDALAQTRATMMAPINLRTTLVMDGREIAKAEQTYGPQVHGKS